MQPTRPNGYVLIAFAIVITSLFIASANPVDDSARPAEQKIALIRSLQGPDLFHSYCASCHGLAGKGDGPAAAALNSKLPDLTTIALRHGGVFPEKWVREVITGDQSILGHGSREMPVWGPIFHQIENDHDYGEIRLKNVTTYLQSIQQR